MPFRPSQKTFRGRNDDVTLNSSTFTYSTNANWTQDSDVVFRVRFVVQEADTTAGSYTYHLRYSYNGGAYTKVTGSTSEIQIALSSQYADKNGTTKVLDGTGTWVNGQGLESSTDTDAINLPSAGNTEIEFCLKIIGSAITDGFTILLRLYRGTSTALYAYTNTPTITINKVLPARTAQLDKTLDGIGLAATGALPIAGSLSKTLGALTLTSTLEYGSAEINAQLDKTLGALTLSATGALPIAASLSKTLGVMTLSAQASLPIAAALNKLLGSLTLSAEAEAEIRAQFDKTLGALTLEGRLTPELPPLNLVLDKTLGALTLNSRLAFQANMELAKVLGSLTLSAEVEALIAASLSKTLGALTVEGRIEPALPPLDMVLNTVLGVMTLQATLGGPEVRSTGGDGPILILKKRERGYHWHETMKKFNEKQLHSGSVDGPLVTDPKQARAIAYSIEKKKQERDDRLDDLAMGNPFNSQRL